MKYILLTIAFVCAMNLSECAPCLDDLLALEAEAALLDYEFPLNTYGNYRYNRRVDYPPLGDVYNTPGTWSQEEQSWRPSVDPDDRPIRYVSVPVQYNPSPITEIQVGR